jgi:hypothetical protein
MSDYRKVMTHGSLSRLPFRRVAKVIEGAEDLKERVCRALTNTLVVMSEE